MELTGYELLASGAGQRLERWAGRVILRPETAAAWPWPSGKTLPDWDGLYHGQTASGGRWEWKKPLPSPCLIKHGNLSFVIKATVSKHLGIFPEQSTNWNWITQRLAASNVGPFPPRILNLFGYTGGATLAAAAAGASVTHIDSSKAMVAWCSENARLSCLEKASIRYIVEDAMTFIQREIRRGNRYDAVIMDPPAYGRGKGGELWKLSEHLPSLLDAVLSVLSDSPVFILLNTYSESHDEESGNLFRLTTGGLGGSSTTVSLGLAGSIDGQFLPLGKAHRWVTGGQ